MTPDQIAKSGSEHGHQSALFAYCAVARIHGFDAADAWAAGDKLPAPNPDEGDKVPALEWFHAIHNQGHGDKVRGGMAKAEGVRKGIADTFLPWPAIRETYEVRLADDLQPAHKRIVVWSGLYIEMKKPSEKPKSDKAKGGVSTEQSAFGAYCNTVGYGWIVCYSWREAADVLRRYIEWGKQ